MRKYKITYNIYQVSEFNEVEYTYRMKNIVVEAFRLEDAVCKEIERQKKNGVDIDVIKVEAI